MHSWAFNCLGYWHRRLKEAGLPVPDTRIYRVEKSRNLFRALDGTDEGADEVLALARRIISDLRSNPWPHGKPAFFRTGQTSAKHQWEDTCFLTEFSVESLCQKILGLIEYSVLADFVGLPCGVFCVRQFLEGPVLFYAFKNMPIRREFRCFADERGVHCIHFYWPAEAFENEEELNDEEVRKVLAASAVLTEKERAELTSLATKAQLAIGEDRREWSIDILETNQGWFITDCAIADESFHEYQKGECNSWKIRGR